MNPNNTNGILNPICGHGVYVYVYVWGGGSGGGGGGGHSLKKER
jgi:hypothetical protein